MLYNPAKNKSHIAFLIITLSTGITAIILGKDTNWDLRNYHLYNGYAFLTNRLDYDIAPAQIQTYINPLYDVFIFLGISHLPPKVFGFILGTIQGISIWLVYQLTRSLTREYPAKSSLLLAILASVTAFLGAGWFGEIGNTMGDSIVSIFVLSALLIIVSCPTPITLTYGKRGLIGAGFLFGFATGLKLVAGIYLAGFALSVAFLMEKRQVVKQYIVLIASFSVGLAVSIGFWIVKLWDKFQSPLFPFYNKIFKSPYYDLVNFTDDRFLPRTFLQKLFYPFFFLKSPNLVCEQYFRDCRLTILYVTVLLFLLWLITHLLPSRQAGKKYHINDYRKTFFFVSFCLFSYIGWQVMFSIYRYVIPLELLTPVVVILILSTTIKDPALSCMRASGILVFMCVTVTPMTWGRIPWGNSYFSITSTTSLTKFKNSTILMSGGKPTAYVIPFFPKSTKFVRIESNFIRPGQNNKLQVEIEKAINQSQNLKMLLAGPSEADPAKALNINVDLNSCDFIASSMGDELVLCDASVNK